MATNKRPDYLFLITTCVLTKDELKIRELEFICGSTLRNQHIYAAVEENTKIPWPLIAAIHFRESNQNFKKHLHNGDPLTDRTIHVPKGRPLLGEPPFTWEVSAIDALSKFWKPKRWDLPGSLEFLERYNGLGYQKENVYSPYLWNYTNMYTKGLFTSDGHFDSEKIERRPGCVAILETLAMKGVSLDFTSVNRVVSGV